MHDHTTYNHGVNSFHKINWEKVVFCYQNCSDLLWAIIVLVIKKNFRNWRLKAENFQRTKKYELNENHSNCEKYQNRTFKSWAFFEIFNVLTENLKWNQQKSLLKCIRLAWSRKIDIHCDECEQRFCTPAFLKSEPSWTWR